MELLIFGLGYVGRALAAASEGARVTGTTRRPTPDLPSTVVSIPPEETMHALAVATHLLVTAPPGVEGDPLLALDRAPAAIARSPLRWIGYLSTTGVYGDHGGGWVDEATPPAPGSERTVRRVAAESAWSAFADARAVDIFRLAGIYGPGRSVLDDLRAGRARRVVKPGHAFGRIHRDDIVRAIRAAMAQERGPGARIFNLSDDEPAESAAVIEEAARLLGVVPPPEVAFADAWVGMSPMARSFWSENRKVSSQATKAALGLSWLYPTYREGLRAILAAEREEHPLQ
ncbi:MAG: SDR family oxidoreductase [Acetobacteraceae bacterium]|nr:SDR family oxidoreductase [Acetobacteraceae bacterium]